MIGLLGSEARAAQHRERVASMRRLDAVDFAGNAGNGGIVAHCSKAACRVGVASS